MEHPSNMLVILGKSLPNVVGYFATFLMTKIFAGLPLICLRFEPLFRLLFLKLCFREKYLTEAEIDEVYYPQQFSQVNDNFDFVVKCEKIHPNYFTSTFSIASVWLGVPKSPIGRRYLLCLFMHLTNYLASGGGVLPW